MATINRRRMRQSSWILFHSGRFFLRWGVAWGYSIDLFLSLPPGAINRGPMSPIRSRQNAPSCPSLFYHKATAHQHVELPPIHV